MLEKQNNTSKQASIQEPNHDALLKTKAKMIKLITLSFCGAVILLLNFPYTSEKTPNVNPQNDQSINSAKVENRLGGNDAKLDRNVRPVLRSKQVENDKIKDLPKWTELYGRYAQNDFLSTLKVNLETLAKSVPSYNGIMASRFVGLKAKLDGFSIKLKVNKNLPLAEAFNSKLQFQIVDGYVLGADIQFQPGFSGADWDMLSEILCSGALHQTEPAQQDLMMWMDKLLISSQQANLKPMVSKGSWLIGDNANQQMSINYKVSINPSSDQGSARFWLSFK